jgi:putative tricarboxylic transport membrane protein
MGLAKAFDPECSPMLGSSLESLFQKGEYNLRKLLIVATAAALVASTLAAVPASAAGVSSKYARYGLACDSLKQVAVSRGADRSNLVCKVETAGSYKGKKIWAYPTFPSVKNMDVYMAGGAGGGYDTFGRELMRSMKAEGTLKTQATFRNLSGAGGTKGLSAFLYNEYRKPGKAMVTGFAMIGGVASTKVNFKTSSTVPVARMMGEWEVVVVPSDSPYLTLADLVKDIKAKKATLPIAGGNLGGIDHYTAVLMYEAMGLGIKDLNYVVYSGGAEVTAALLNGSSKAGISGYGEFQGQVEAGTLRVLGISSNSKVPGIAAATLKSQGVNVVVGNWRGLMLPKGTSVANRNLVIRALDVTRNGVTWKKVMKDNIWANNWLAGDAYDTWLKRQETSIANIYKELGL